MIWTLTLTASISKDSQIWGQSSAVRDHTKKWSEIQVCFWATGRCKLNPHSFLKQLIQFVFLMVCHWMFNLSWRSFHTVENIYIIAFSKGENNFVIGLRKSQSNFEILNYMKITDKLAAYAWERIRNNISVIDGPSLLGIIWK